MSNKHHAEAQKHGSAENCCGQTQKSFRDSLISWFPVELLLPVICNARDGCFERALLENDIDAISDDKCRCVTNDTRMRSVPGHGVAAPEYRQWAQAVDARGQRTDAPLGAGEPAPDGCLQLRFARHQARADRAKAVPRIELVERAAQHFMTTGASRRALADALAQRCCELRYVPSAHREAAFVSRESGASLQQVQARFHPPQPVMNGRIETLASAPDVG